MAIRLQFEGIRCFVKQQDVPIRPVTLLVGENSSGKTTFLAICRIAHAIATGAVPGFNDPPFSLGAYEQVASRSNGRGRPATSFSVGIGLDKPEHCSLRATFVESLGQPELALLLLTAGRLRHQIAPEARGSPLLPYPAPAGPLRQAAEAILQALIRTYAFAPIRTSPKRTYDPVAALPDPEGSHVPMLLAALARSAAAKGWSAMQAALADFGVRSGLFDAIEVINKGKKESDPFQIGVKSAGGAFNLIDVGYGVSQVLPILVDTTRRGVGQQTSLLQQPEVHLHPRAQAELGSFFARQADHKRRFVIETHSDHLIDRIRMEVRRKTLGPGDVALLYFERGKKGATIHHLELDKQGSITNAPPGYRQFFLDEERELLGI